MSPSISLEDLRGAAAAVGIPHVGVTTPEASEHVPFYREWLERGYHGEMGYLARPDAVARRGALEETLPGVRSVVVAADPYPPDDPPGLPDDPSRGVIARYARGRDYHRVLDRKLRRLGRWLVAAVGESVAWRAYVDHGPLLERDLARRAGLGWFGKNTMLIHPKRGSYFFLGVLLTDVELPTDEPFKADHCGSCTACLDACPTGALLGRDEHGAPVMDTRLCISYLTIEHRGSIPEELRPLMGNRVFGCDICQEVCPWNERFAEAAVEAGYASRDAWEAAWDATSGGEDVSAETPDDVSAETSDGQGGPTEATIPGTDGPSLIDLMRMSEDEWDAFTRGSAIRRAGYAGLRRNVAMALGNWLAGSAEPQPDVVGELMAALSDEHAVVADAAAWALGKAET